MKRQIHYKDKLEALTHKVIGRKVDPEFLTSDKETQRIKKSSIPNIVLCERAGWYHREIGAVYKVSTSCITRLLRDHREEYPPSGDQQAKLEELRKLRTELFAGVPDHHPHRRGQKASQ